MTSAVAESIAFLRQNDVKTILARIRQREVPGLIQFAIYGLCGGLATVVFVGTVVLFSKTLVPAYTGMRIAENPVTAFGQSIYWPSGGSGGLGRVLEATSADDQIRARNLLVNNCIGFLIANVVAYVSNVLFVFKTGRHHPILEFLYFTTVSGISFGLSQVAGPWLVSRFGVPTNLAILSNVVASMMLNFVGRKFFVFKE